MHRKRGLRFEKKQLVEFPPREKKVDFQSLARPDDFVRYGRRALVGLRVEGSFQNRRVKGSEAPTHPTQSATTYLSGVCQQPALTHTAVTTKRKGEEERY